MTAAREVDDGDGHVSLGVNEVTVRGRVSVPPVARELPSGDPVVMLRVVVPRPASVRRREDNQAVQDTIDVACWSALTRRAARRVCQGDLVTVQGALRRRFWRTAFGAVSRYEVEAHVVRREAAVPSRPEPVSAASRDVPAEPAAKG